MEYMSVNEASVNWQVTPRRIRQYLKEGLIENAIRKGRIWLLPANAMKPDDRRGKPSHDPAYHKYTFPFLLATVAVNDVASLSQEEKELMKLQYYGQSGDMEKLWECADKLLKKTKDTFIQSGVYFSLCLSTIYTGSAKELHKYYTLLSNTYNPKDSKEKELLLTTVLMSFYQVQSSPDWLREGDYSDISIDCLFWADTQNLFYHLRNSGEKVNPVYFEPLCSHAKMMNIPLVAEYDHLFLGMIYHYLGSKEKAIFHYQKAIDIAYQYHYYAPLGALKKPLGLVFERLMKEKDKGFYKAVSSLNKIITPNWSNIYKTLSGPHPTRDLSLRESEVCMYLAQGLRSKEIAKALDVSTETVNSIINSVYLKMHISNRKELINTLFSFEQKFAQ